MLKRYLNFFIIIAILALPVAVFAAWRDAPAAAPNYGAVSPDTQADYKPVNLGDTVQTKIGGLNIMGNVGIGTTTPAAKLSVNDSGVNIVNLSLVKTIGGSNNLTIGNTFIGGSTFALNAGITNINNSGFEIRDLNVSLPRMVIDTNGNIGIGGITTPTAKLAVNNPTTVGKVGSLGDSIYAYASSTNAAISAEQASSTGYAIYASGQSYFKNSNPTQTKTVTIESLSGESDIHYINASGATTNTWQVGVNNAGNGTNSNQFYVHDGVYRLTVQRGTGNIGIGTTTPGFKLDINGTTNGKQLRINTSGVYGPSIGFNQAGSQYAVIGLVGAMQGNTTKDLGFLSDYTNGNISFFTNGDASRPKMTILSNGNIGIETTTPAYKLDVAGQIRSSSGGFVFPDGTTQISAANGGGNVSGPGSSGYDSYLPKWSNSSTNSLVYSDIYNSGGNVGIGTTVLGSYKLNVAGDIYSSGSGTSAGGWFVSSDARLKKNVETLSGALEKVGRIRGVSYNLVSGSPDRQIGVIAQELEQEFPELVITDGNGYKAVAYDRLSAVLIEAVKELRAQNQSLQQRLDLIEKKW